MLEAKSQQELSRLVAENIFSFDAKFWMRIATRNDSLKNEADKDKLKAVADTVMVLVDAMVKQTEQQLNDSAAVLQEVLKAAADEKGEWYLPLDPEQVSSVRAALDKHSERLDEALLSNCFAWMKKCQDDRMDTMVALLQKVLQLYAAKALRGQEAEGVAGVLNEVVFAEEQDWEPIIRRAAATGDVAEAAFMEVLQKKMEATVLGMQSGSYAQRVQAEYLKEIEARAKTVFRQLAAAHSPGPAPLCVAAVNFGAAGIGDVNKQEFIGSFSVVVLHGALQGPVSPWVLGWHFAAGERIPQTGSVFGGLDSREVFLTTAGQQQRAAVFSNSSIGPGPESHASFSFVGLKGPNATASAPFRLAPPTNVVLNNLFCWPLLRPSASTAAAAAGAASSGDSSPALGRAAATASGVAERVSAAVQVAPAAASGQRQVSVPQVPEEELPRQLLVEYVPVDYLPEGLNRPAYFYFKLSKPAQADDTSSPIYLDQVTLQYWFQGPRQAAAAAEAAAAATGTDGATSSRAAQADAALLDMTCTDAQAPLACQYVKWSITPALPGVFGARFLLSIMGQPANRQNCCHCLTQQQQQRQRL
ncbi:hypothetical protein OEZ85_010221 [Tetradesmus obliquus]|uniref:Uncharacterized protein n=1 Tax=Tetradesmus obliquus TaxID=3088 RepID=A0ABY8TM90_TETOB|nr:hypothetical protein OEZ85_010221 [Tetradesmus obliquus]